MAKNESSENYLEAILMLSKKLPVVRSVDIANELGFKKSSVSIAMKKLRHQRICTNTLVNASKKAEKFITFQPFSLPFCRLYRFTATYFICCFP